MKWPPGTDNDDVVDVRGSGGGGGGGRGMGGGMRRGGGGLIAVIAIVVVARLLGYDASALLADEPGGAPSVMFHVEHAKLQSHAEPFGT